MNLFIVIPLAFLAPIIVSLILIYFWGYWGTLWASCLTGPVISYALFSMSGVGRATGYSREFNSLEFIKNSLIIFLYSFLVYYGLYFLKKFITKEYTSRYLNIFWVTILSITILVHLSIFLYKEYHKSNLLLSLQYNEPLRLDGRSVEVKLVNGKKEVKISFNSRGGTKHPNRFGYKLSLRGSKTIYSPPQFIFIKIHNKYRVRIPFPESAQKIIVFVNKNYEVKLLINDQLQSVSYQMIE